MRARYPACSSESAIGPFAAIGFVYAFPSLPNPTSPHWVTRGSCACLGGRCWSGGAQRGGSGRLIFGFPGPNRTPALRRKCTVTFCGVDDEMAVGHYCPLTKE